MILVTVSEGATASERKPKVPLPTVSDISEARFSEIPLAPLKTLATESATVGLSVSVLNPVKRLATASEIAGLSDDALNPLKTLVARSEGATASERKPKVPLPTVSDIREARFSEIPLAPLKTLATESATVGLSVSVLNPAKSLPTTSEGATLSSANFPAPLLSESVIAEARFSGTPLNPVKTLDAISEMAGVSVRLLNPVKSLLVTSDSAAVSETNFPADLCMLSVTSP